MFRILMIAALTATAMALSACNPAAALRDESAETTIKTAFERLRTGDPAFTAMLVPETASQVTPELLAQMRAQIPAKAPRSRTAVGTQIINDSLTAIDTYDFVDRQVEVNTVLVHPQGSKAWQVLGIHVQSATAAQMAANRLFAPGKPLWQYLFALLAITSPVSMVAALVKVIRTKGLRRKWLWGIVAFVGLAQIQMNWASGEIAYSLVSIQLIGFGVTRMASAMAPWLITFTLPIGAVLILTGVWANPKRAKPSAPLPDQAF